MIHRSQTAGGLAASAGLRPGGRRDARPTGFTLIETLVAVGALAFVATGIAVIFEATGRTVTTGKRVSAFNTAAAAIEHQLRADIASMTRGGFLVIRNEYADANVDGSVEPNTLNNNPDVVALYDGDMRPRLRRTDELMFFAKGQFKSARPPLVAGYEARAEAARVYYGHGQRWRPDNTVQYKRPTLDQISTDSQTILGYADTTSPVPNPNRYASDWTLLRQVTLLCPPQAAARPTAAAVANVADTDFQVALRPAAANVFRALAFPVSTVSSPPPGYPSVVNPAFASGLIDIATTDLPEIRSVVLTADVMPGNGLDGSFLDPASNNGAEGGNAGVDGLFSPGIGGLGGVLDRQQAWMEDALPAWSHASTATDRYRVRYEPAPPDFAGVLEDTSGTPVDREVRRADQMMLSSANFLPRCTEFIVEWSFGRVYPVSGTLPSGSPDPAYRAGYEGQAVWHGMERKAEQSTATMVGDLLEQAMPYDETDLHAAVWFLVERNDRSLGDIVHGVTSKMIHGVNAGSVVLQTPVTSYFGYVDPTFDPDRPALLPTPAPANGKLGDPQDAASATVPWKWPTMIRVTLSLADPNDPSYERTFQFVFDVPRDAAQ